MSASHSDTPQNGGEIAAVVEEEVGPQRLIVGDWHTHLLSPLAGPALSLHGVDRLLTYHYVRRKLFAGGHVSPEEFISWDLEKQGDFTLRYSQNSSDDYDNWPLVFSWTSMAICRPMGTMT